MIQRILIANRGEIACRIIETCNKLNIETIAIYSTPDEHSKHVALADEAIHIGPGAAAESYLRQDKIIAIASKYKADAIHPGYGFLAENFTFAEAVESAGITWIGPSANAIKQMGDKLNARAIAQRIGVPTIPGLTGVAADLQSCLKISDILGYPVLLKASGGGGGMGMVIINSSSDLLEKYNRITNLAKRLFENELVYVEKLIANARHIEVQLIGMQNGEIHLLGDRDCSLQRRNQKMLEESPATILSEREREELYQYAISIAEEIRYEGVGTVEFLFDMSDRKLYFLEMNTRLQVEHPITEMRFNCDLVEAQIRIANGDNFAWSQDIQPAGHSIELRICAESPDKFIPNPGMISMWSPPSVADHHIRVDSGYREGDIIPREYDSLIAKLCVYDLNRQAAIERMKEAIEKFNIGGVKTTLPVGSKIMHNDWFLQNRHNTNSLSYIVRT